MANLSTQVLGGFKTGMDRSSRRGGRDGAQRLYTLQNAYLNERGEAVPRPGLQHVANVAHSAGLYGWKGQLHVFHDAQASYVDPANPLVAAHIVPYPLANAPTDTSIAQMHFIGVILGELYLAVEFADSTLRHYWLQEPEAWQANHVYGLGAIVQPTTPNGFYYQLPTSNPAQAWQPGTLYTLNDVVQPTVPNGYTYKVVDVTGTPTSGETEPTWPTSPGAQVFEGTDSTTVPSDSTPPSGTSSPIGSKITDRYGNPKLSGDV